MVPSFTDLAYFYEVANTLNFSHAALKLGISQPSISMAINRLEKSLKTTLFIRHKHGITLTPSGRKLFHHSFDLLHKWQKTETIIQEINQEVCGVVLFGCHPTLGPIIAQLFSDLLLSYPSLKINIKNMMSYKITEMVNDGMLDIGIVIDPVEHSDLIMFKIADVEMSCWSSPDYYQDNPSLFCDPEIPQVQFLLKRIDKKQSLDRICAINDFETIANLTVNQAGIGILPSCFVERQYKSKLKRVINLPNKISKMYLIYRYENRNIPANRMLINAIKMLCQQRNNNLNHCQG